MGYLLGLFVALVAFWLAMSGLMKPLLLSLGAVSVAITLFLAMRLDVVDKESAPYLRWPVFIGYWFWLMGEIIKANWRVIRACLRADLDINPALVKVKTRCKSDLAKTTFANSITLTPGTVTLSVEGDKLLVHALYEQDAEPGAFDDMDRRTAAAAEGAPA
ncbi:MAG: cation:proton antiporter [Alphaproteobacteria bacterium]|nr:cation:proton antiporter [Alphaproteobacteria bacterium]